LQAGITSDSLDDRQLRPTRSHAINNRLLCRAPVWGPSGQLMGQLRASTRGPWFCRLCLKYSPHGARPQEASPQPHTLHGRARPVGPATRSRIRTPPAAGGLLATPEVGRTGERGAQAVDAHARNAAVRLVVVVLLGLPGHRPRVSPLLALLLPLLHLTVQGRARAT
jgi:hypothetical protein